jgi:hypothetical protein
VNRGSRRNIYYPRRTPVTFLSTRRFLHIALSGLLVALPLVASAGEGRHGEGKRHHDPEARLERMTEHLNLTAEQQAELQPILEQQAESFRAMRERKEAGESREQLRADMHAQRDADTAEIEAILDEEQVAEFRERRAEHKAKRREHHRERRGAEGAPENAL